MVRPIARQPAHRAVVVQRHNPLKRGYTRFIVFPPPDPSQSPVTERHPPGRKRDLVPGNFQVVDIGCQAAIRHPEQPGLTAGTQIALPPQMRPPERHPLSASRLYLREPTSTCFDSCGVSDAKPPGPLHGGGWSMRASTFLLSAWSTSSERDYDRRDQSPPESPYRYAGRDRKAPRLSVPYTSSKQCAGKCQTPRPEPAKRPSAGNIIAAPRPVISALHRKGNSQFAELHFRARMARAREGGRTHTPSASRTALWDRCSVA